MSATPISNFAVTVEDVTATATSVRNTVREIESEMSRLRAFVAGTADYWRGADQGAFVELMRSFDGNAQSLSRALDGIADGLQGNAVNYATAGSDNASTLNQTAANLPPARF